MPNRKTRVIITRSSNNDYLAHAGKKGMKWGFNDGKKNGKRTAEEEDTKDTVVDGKKYMIEDSKVWEKKSGSEDGYGTYTHKNSDGSYSTLERNKSDEWFSSTKTLVGAFGKTTIKEIGKFEQYTDKAKNWLSNLF